jgi:hypothetical protein
VFCIGLSWTSIGLSLSAEIVIAVCEIGRSISIIGLSLGSRGKSRFEENQG